MRGWNTPQLSGGAEWSPPEAEEMNDDFDDRYQISKLLGRGGMGAVYLATDSRLDRKVAIKMLPPELGDHEEALTRFEREAKAMAALEHPNIINVYDYGSTPKGHLFIVMEFIDGTDLHQLRSSGDMDLNGALDIVSQVCAALQFAHSQGIIHRDIKPANILVGHNGSVKVADFGLAKVFGTESRPNHDASLTHTGASMGTPDYMAPEQRQGESVDHRADIYALGVMLYDLLTGAPPRGAWTAPSQKVEIDIRLDEIIIGALQENPVARYQAAGEVKDDVDSVKTSTGGAPIPVGSAVAPLPSTNRKSSGIAKPRTAPGSYSTTQPTQEYNDAHRPLENVPTLDAIVQTTKSTNRTMLLLGTFAILTIGAIAIYVGAFKKDGDTYYTVNNTSYQEIQNNYFSKIVVNGTTTKEDLEKIQSIQPYGTLFIGISKDPMTLAEAQDLAQRTGSSVLDYSTNQPNKPAPLNTWLTSSYSLKQKAWVQLHSQYQLIDGNASLSTAATPEAEHYVLLAWQGPKDLMMNAEGVAPKSKPPTTNLSSPEPNLVLNPGCEMPLKRGEIPHWKANSGAWRPGNKDPSGVIEGKYYFFAGVSKIGELVQNIDLSAFADKKRHLNSHRFSDHTGQTNTIGTLHSSNCVFSGETGFSKPSLQATYGLKADGLRSCIQALSRKVQTAYR